MAIVFDDEEEEPVVFNNTHYKNGLNGDFIGEESDRSAEDVIAEFAGASGGGGKFEDTEKRDIARAVPAIVKMLVEEVGTPPNGTLLDIGAGTGLLLKPMSELVPQGRLLAADISPDFCAWMVARVESLGLSNVDVVACTGKDPLPPPSASLLDLDKAPSVAAAVAPVTAGALPPAGANDATAAPSTATTAATAATATVAVEEAVDGSVDTAVMIDVYHHLEYPRTVMRKLRRRMKTGPHSRLVIIDFHRDPEKVKSRGPDWPLVHLRAGQGVFRQEITSSGWVLVCEPEIAELNENYVMVFRPKTSEEVSQEMASAVGSGWADKPVPAAAPQAP